MWDWDSGVAGDELELVKEGLWAQTGKFDRQMDNVARKVWGETTVGRDKGRNRLSDDAVVAKFVQSRQGRLICIEAEGIYGI